MKKILALLLTTAMVALTLCGCKIGECDLCGDTGILTEESFLGMEINVCTDCSN